MEQLNELMKRVARLVELESLIPLAAEQQAVQKAALADLKYSRDWYALEAKRLESPNFFQKLLPGFSEKQEKAQRDAREAAAAYEQGKRELETTEHTLASHRQELEALAGCKEEYDRARQLFRTIATEEELARLQEAEIDTFRPVAIACLRMIRKDLNRSHDWMPKHDGTRARHGNHETRQMEFWELADLHARQLQSLLPYFPENRIQLGASITCPSQYIRSASMNYAQLDRLNIAVEQSLLVQKQIEQL